MSFGFSVSDLVAGGKLAYDIYQQCFTKARGADVKYLQFGREINLLGDSLKRLENIVNNADVQHPRRPWHKDAHHVGPNTLQEVTGDFLGTLSECEALLEDNSKFRRSAANFVDNVMWWSATERDVTSLKGRVHFHVTKITLIAKPFETQLLLGIRRELKQLRRDVADLRGVLVQDVHPVGEVLGAKPSFSVPEDLSLRFMGALYVNKPKAFEILGHFPLKEGFDGLVFAFANSTVEFNPGPGLGQNFPEETQYLNLVKSRWIASRLEESDFYRAAGADSLWADYMRELKDDIRDQFLRFDAGNLVAPAADAVARLPDSCFSIWVVEEASPRPPDLAEERPLEEKILELSLSSSYGNRQSALTIFRKSEVELRLVSTTKDELNKDFHREESMDINMNFTRLIPAYASPDDSSKPTNNVLLCTNQGQNQKWLTLKEAADVARLQQALTGYRVFHDMSNVSWSIEGSSKPHKSGQGRLQLWHLKPLPKMPSEGETIFPESRSPTVSSPQSPPLGGHTMHRYSTGMSSATFVSKSSSVKSPVKGICDNGIALLRPEPPALIMLTMSEKRYAFLHIQFDPSISLKPELCLCQNPKKSCRRVVLGSTSKKIEIRRHCVEQRDGNGLHDWDIARIRWPRHAEYKTLEVIQKKYLCLDFPSVLEKDEFIGEFGLLEGLRNLDLNDYERCFREKKYKANNPQHRKDAITHDRKGGEDGLQAHGQSFRYVFEPSLEGISVPENRLQADDRIGYLPTDSNNEQDSGNNDMSESDDRLIQFREAVPLTQKSPTRSIYIPTLQRLQLHNHRATKMFLFSISPLQQSIIPHWWP